MAKLRTAEDLQALRRQHAAEMDPDKTCVRVCMTGCRAFGAEKVGGAFRNELESRGLPESRIVVFGRSLGGAVAVDLVQGRRVAGLILESTFTSAADVARSALGWPAAALVRGRFDSAAKIGEVRCPILFFHGDRDEIIPYPLGRRLFEQAPEPKAFETIHAASHNDTVEVGGRPYFARIGEFLDEVTPE